MYISLQVHGGKGEQNLRQVHLGGSAQQVNPTIPLLLLLCIMFSCSIVVSANSMRGGIDFLAMFYILIHKDAGYQIVIS